MYHRKIKEAIEIDDSDSKEDIERKLKYGEKEFKVRIDPISWLKKHKWYNFNDHLDTIAYITDINYNKAEVTSVVFYFDFHSKKYIIDVEYLEYNESGELYDPLDVDIFHKEKVEPADRESFRDILRAIFTNTVVIQNKKVFNYLKLR